MSLYLGENKIADNTCSRNIGEIVASTIPLTDAGLHLLDGVVINGAGSYAKFVNYIAGLVTDYPDLFTTEANWQSAVSTYGVCGKFVYDSVNNTVRLPKLYANERYLIKSYSSGTDWYRIYSDGWCEQGGQIIGTTSGTLTYLKPYQDTNYTIFMHGVGTYNGSVSGNGLLNPQTRTASSCTYYQDSNVNTIMWQACGYTDISNYIVATQYEYIVIATMTKTDIQVDIDEVMTDLNGKVSTSDLATCHVVIETYNNGTDWYRIYSDGWCEQGGRNTVSGDGTYTVYLLKQYIDTNYTITQWSGLKSTYSNQYNNGVSLTAINSDSFSYNSYDYNNTLFWQACGYIR